MGEGCGMDRAAAARGFPPLRGCPSTVVMRRLAVLGGLSGTKRLDCADQLSTLAEALAMAHLTQADRGILLAGLPILAGVEASEPGRPELGFQGVKALARLAREPGGIAAFVRMQGLEGPAAEPRLPHVGSFDAAVPVAPGRLRKAVLGAPLPQGRMLLNLGLGGKRWGATSRQLAYGLWADPDGVRLQPTSHEAVWLQPALWGLITVATVEAVAQHLVRVVEARRALV